MYGHRMNRNFGKCPDSNLTTPLENCRLLSRLDNKMRFWNRTSTREVPTASAETLLAHCTLFGQCEAGGWGFTPPFVYFLNS